MPPRKGSADSRSPGARGARELARVARDGGVTFILGAGVSMPFGIPSWGGLTAGMWKRALGVAPPPEIATMPHFFPFAFERIARTVGAAAFPERLRSALYAGVRLPSARALERSDHSLAVIARLLVAQHRAGPSRPIVRVVTFNADDLLEQAVRALAPDEMVVKVIARAGHHPMRGADAAIPIYHVHGYLPQDARAPWYQQSPDAIVFTDSQYWASVASPLSFANRTMAFALHDSRCVFLGTSMTDVNLLRWLATRAIELEADRARELSLRRHARPRRAFDEARRAMRHFWIHVPSGDGFVADCARLRGVAGVPIASWSGPALRTLLEGCFRFTSRAGSVLRG